MKLEHQRQTDRAVLDGYTRQPAIKTDEGTPFVAVWIVHMAVLVLAFVTIWRIVASIFAIAYAAMLCGHVYGQAARIGLVEPADPPAGGSPRAS